MATNNEPTFSQQCICKTISSSLSSTSIEINKKEAKANKKRRDIPNVLVIQVHYNSVKSQMKKFMTNITIGINLTKNHLSVQQLGVFAMESSTLFTTKQVQILSKTLSRAIASCDFGAEVVSRLLNDQRSLFKTLLAKNSDENFNSKFNAQIVRELYPRASYVADGITKFFIKVLNLIEIQDDEELRKIAYDNGAMHYRIKVYFQAENWLCVKRCIIDTVSSANAKPVIKVKKRFTESVNLDCVCDSSHNEIVNLDIFEHVWVKLMTFIICNMKKGFLETALEQDIHI